jgi:hypothetical protein
MAICILGKNNSSAALPDFKNFSHVEAVKVLKDIHHIAAYTGYS